MSIAFAILLFSVLIFVHEFGHFAAAKLSGVQVNEFSMFMGPALVKWQRGETLYSIRCIPIGGYCAMEGEDGDSDNPHAFGKAAWWKRLIILVAGSAMNLVTALVIFGIVYMPMKYVSQPVITEFMDCCIFNREDGLRAGDEILEIDGERVYINNDISLLFAMNATGTHDLVVLRDGQKLVFDDLPMVHSHTDDNGETYNHYGIYFGESKPAGFLDKLEFIWKLTLDNVRNTRLSLQMLLTGQAKVSDLTGVVGIVDMMSDMAEESETVGNALRNMLNFGGFIAVNLAVMNLLPLPALDGGRAVCLLLTTAAEKVLGRKLDPKYEGYIHGAGLVILLILMALIMFKDIFMIIKG